MVQKLRIYEIDWAFTKRYIILIKKCSFVSKMSLILEIKINETDHFKAKVLTPSKIKAIKNIQERLINNQNQIKMLKASYFRHIIDI